MTPLNRIVKRKSDSLIRDGSKSRELVVALYPGGTIGLRPLKTRREEFVSLRAVYQMAVRLRVANERANKQRRNKR